MAPTVKSDQSKVNASQVKIPQPYNILTDIYGVISSWQFVKELKKYVRNRGNLTRYLTDNWNHNTVKHIVTKLREQSEIDRNVESSSEIPLIETESKNVDRSKVINSVVNNILWQIENKHKGCKDQLNSLYSEMWTEAYEKGRIKTHAFDDVLPQFKHWKTNLLIKIYCFASGHPNGQRLFLSVSKHGDISKYIINCIDSSGSFKYDEHKYHAVLIALREKTPKNLLYLTDEPQKARLAIKTGMRSVVVLRDGNQVYTEQQLSGLLSVKSLNDLILIEDANNAPCC